MKLTKCNDHESQYPQDTTAVFAVCNFIVVFIQEWKTYIYIYIFLDDWVYEKLIELYKNSLCCLHEKFTS